MTQVTLSGSEAGFVPKCKQCYWLGAGGNCLSHQKHNQDDPLNCESFCVITPDLKAWLDREGYGDCLRMRLGVWEWELKQP